MNPSRARRWIFQSLSFVFLFCLVFASADVAEAMGLSSPAFGNAAQIPPEYARTHDNLSPPLAFSGVPAEARSLALIVDDPDAPGGLFTHWVIWNILPNSSSLGQGRAPAGAMEGENSFGDTHYDGPKPPNGRHRYFFHLYALDTMLSLPAGSKRDALEAAMKGHVVAKAKMFGTFATGQ